MAAVSKPWSIFGAVMRHMPGIMPARSRRGRRAIRRDAKGNVIACAIGKSAARNIASEPNVSRFWPPREPGGYALVVNGTATRWRQLSGVTRAEITLTKSVPHRARTQPPDSDRPCSSDYRHINAAVTILGSIRT